MAEEKKTDIARDEQPRASNSEIEEPKAKAEPAAKKLVVRLLADYWDSDGVRHSANYIDDNGEKHETGALIELPATEARALVKGPNAERGDDF